MHNEILRLKNFKIQFNRIYRFHRILQSPIKIKLKKHEILQMIKKIKFYVSQNLKRSNNNYSQLECNDGFYGNNCSKKCLCQNDALCDNVNGFCKCQPGWNGTKCEKECKDSWGPDCKFKFSCATNNTLKTDHVTGKCFCKDGFIGPK